MGTEIAFVAKVAMSQLQKEDFGHRYGSALVRIRSFFIDLVLLLLYFSERILSLCRVSKACSSYAPVPMTRSMGRRSAPQLGAFSIGSLPPKRPIVPSPLLSPFTTYPHFPPLSNPSY